MANHEEFDAGQKTILFYKEGQEQSAKKATRWRKWSLFCWEPFHWWIRWASSACTVFNGQHSALPFFVHFGRIDFNPHFAYFLGCLQSKDWSVICVLCTLLRTIRGLFSQSGDCYANLKSEVCTGKAMDFSGPCLAHNTYVLCSTVWLLLQLKAQIIAFYM